MSPKREESRARRTALILQAARDEIATKGGGGLSMRSVARSVQMASSAVYRYFPTREDLLTAMILESYGHLAAALGNEAHPHDWVSLAGAMRNWAIGSPHEYQLIYGTPIPGYRAPPETIPYAAAVARPFLMAASCQESTPDEFDQPELTAQMVALTDDVPQLSGGSAAWAVTELAALIGFISLELSGHFVGTADPADDLFAALVARQSRALTRSAGRI